MSETVVEDRRVQRTKAALFSAFTQLVLSRRYDQIRVADIVEQAGVGRSTFYEHYEGKDELLREGLTGPFSVLADMIGERHDDARLLATVEHFWENRRVGNVLFAGPTARIATATLADLIEARLGAARRNSPPAALVAVSLAAGQLAMISGWLSGRSGCSAQDLARALHAMATASLAALDEA